MIRKTFLLILIFLITGMPEVFSQQTRTLPASAEQFRQAEALFELEKYAAARTLFESIADPEANADPMLLMQASYYTALCAAELEQNDAEFLLEDFIATHKESSLRNQAKFQLGLLQYKKRNYRSALRTFEEIDIRTLSNRELAEMYFKKGYCYLRNEDLDNAKRNFNQLRGTQTAFTTPATYYYAHIAYLEGEYEKALQDFEKIKNGRAFRNTIPLYIVHIHYEQGHYEEVISQGTPLYTSERNRQNLEIGRMIGDAHYRLGNYDEALNYLENYHNNNRRQPSREESFQLAYLYYLNERYAEAIRYFQPATSVDDSLGQYAFYHLADAYLKTDQKQYAGNAFNSAYRMPFNQAIREDALFNYAKLSLEIGINPYNESIKALNQYLVDFPDGNRRQEALSYLVHLYLTTNNYPEALASIENIKEKDDRLNEAYQKITYYRGVELFNDREFFDAIVMFKKSLGNPVDKEIRVESLFWTAEAYFRLSQYELAASYYNQFLNSSTARNHSLYYLAHYNLGYTHFQQKNYNQAIQSFNRFLLNEAKENKRTVSDAYLRTGDSYFITKRYQSAIQQYEKAIRLSTSEADYAAFQKARAQGALGEQQSKINTLQAFQREYSKSPYAPEAFYEMGNTALILNRNNDALQYFGTLMRNYPNSNLAKTALMKTGLVYYNNNDNTRALETFKKIAEDYPGTPEAHEALGNIRNIYVDMNRVDDYLKYSGNLPFAQITDREQDSLIYIAALNKYMEGDCQSASLGFSNYLKRYPKGFYSLNAHFYKAECEYRAGNTADALSSYEEVIERPRSEFTERALLRASKMNQKMNNHNKARGQFIQLEEVATTPTNRMEALTGQLYTSNQLNDNEAVLVAAEKLLSDDRVAETSLAEINVMAGKAAMNLQQNNKAIESFQQSILRSPQGSFGAEASFYLAFLQYKTGKTTEAENTIFDLAANYASYDYWVARGFILLADIYHETGNIFQARQTLQSIIDNHQGEDLRELAEKKLLELPEIESN
jgi:TolA-binding protein